MSQPPGGSASLAAGGGVPHDHAVVAPGTAAAAGGPAHARAGLVPHLAWEGVLGLVALVLVIVMATGTPDGFLTGVLDRAGYLGLTAAGLALSLRAATPNLAIGSVAVLSGSVGAYLATVQGWEAGTAMAFAVALSAVIGLAAGSLVAGLSLPAWAVTLGVAGAIDMWLLGLGGGSGLAVPIRAGYPTAVWFLLFAAVSIGGGVLWWRTPGFRRAFAGPYRPSVLGRWDSALRANRGAVVALVVSNAIAGLAGVALVSHVRFAPAGQPQLLTLTAFAAALIGGVSIFGRRAGVLGTFLGVLVVESLRSLLVHYGASAWAAGMFVGLAVVFGLAVSRMLRYVGGVLGERPAAAGPRGGAPVTGAGAAGSAPEPAPRTLPAATPRTPPPDRPKPRYSTEDR